MRGCVYRRPSGASWYIKYDLPRDPATGKRRIKTKGGFRTRRDAERALHAVLDKLGKGTYVEPTRETVAEFFPRWLSTAAMRGVRPSTLVGYGIMVDKHIVPRLGALALQDLTAAHLNEFYAALLAEGHRQRRGGLSASSVRRIHSVVHRGLADAVRWELLPRNVAATADPPNARVAALAARRKRVFWSEAELRRFLDASRDHRFYPAFHLAALTGMRRGELLGLRWQDVDLDAARLRVEQTLIAPRYQLAISEPKTEHGRRTIQLDDTTVAVLKEQRRHQLAERLAHGAGYQETGLVFGNEDGTPIKPALFTLAFQAEVTRAGLARIRLHDLRHTHAALLGKAGVPPKVVQERLGHHSAAFTLDNYGGTYLSQHQDAAQRVAVLLSGTASTAT